MLMTPRELESAYLGYRTRQNEEWEKVRWSSYYSMVMHSKEGSLEVNKVFVPTDADKPKSVKKLTPDMMMKTTPLKSKNEQ